MRSAPSPKKKTSPLVWVGLAALAVVAYTTLGGDAPPSVGMSKKAKKGGSSKQADLYLPEDDTAKFPPLTLAVNNVFNPQVKKPPKLAPVSNVKAAPGGILQSLTGGEGIWYYTGWVEVDGKRQALLENPTTGEAEYVSAGEGWKKARIGSIDVSSVVLVGPDGKDYSVAIQDFGTLPGQLPAPVADAKGGQPLNVPAGAIAGAIGGAPNSTLAVRPATGMATMTLPNGTTMQVPYDANAAAAGTDQTGNGRRRGRRNRNNANGNNTGDFNNAP